MLRPYGVDLHKLKRTLLAELGQALKGLFVPGIDDEDALETVCLSIRVVHHLAQPEPGFDVAAVLGHDAGQQVARPLAIARLGGLDASAE
jgi:hypothetical protein